MFRWLTLSLCIALVQGVSAQSESFGRLSRMEGDVSVLKAGSAEWEYGTPNLLIEEGDIIKIGVDDFAELEFENGVLIWMDEMTKVRVRYLYKDYEDEDWISGIDIVHGTVRIDMPELPAWDVCLDIETPTGSIRIEEESLVKVIVRRNGASKIIVYRGDAVVAGEWDELYLDAGETVWINSSGELERPSRFATVREDRFDRWCDEYCRDYCVSTTYIHSDIYIGTHYLDTCGDWVWLVDWGWTWRPIVRHGWRPYSHGRWSWSVGFGWFWVSYEPWGWVPFHYGRWAYSPVYGWVWIPGDVWGPGWVAWACGSDWISWAPLGPGDYPALYNGRAYTTVSRDCFVAKLKTRPGEKGYSKYVKVEVAERQWGRKEPEYTVLKDERRVARDGAPRLRVSDGEVAREFKKKDSHSYPHSRKEVGRTISKPAKTFEDAESVSRREYSTREKKTRSRSQKEVVRETPPKAKERRIRKAPIPRPEEKKARAVKKEEKPKSEAKDVRQQKSVPSQRKSKSRRPADDMKVRRPISSR